MVFSIGRKYLSQFPLTSFFFFIQQLEALADLSCMQMALRDGSQRFKNLRENTAGGAGPSPLTLTVELLCSAQDSPQVAAQRFLHSPGGPRYPPSTTMALVMLDHHGNPPCHIFSLFKFCPHNARGQ